MMSSLAEFQEMCSAQGKGLAYSLSCRVMARQSAGEETPNGPHFNI